MFEHTYTLTELCSVKLEIPANCKQLKVVMTPKMLHVESDAEPSIFMGNKANTLSIQQVPQDCQLKITLYCSADVVFEQNVATTQEMHLCYVAQPVMNPMYASPEQNKCKKPCAIFEGGIAKESNIVSDLNIEAKSSIDGSVKLNFGTIKAEKLSGHVENRIGNMTFAVVESGASIKIAQLGDLSVPKLPSDVKLDLGEKVEIIEKEAEFTGSLQYK